MIPIDTKKTSWILRIMAAAICLIAMIFLLTSGILARYASSDKEEGGARVANFYIDADLSEFEQSVPIQLNPNDTEEIIFTVTNGSQVDVIFSASMEFTGNLPLHMTVARCESQDSKIDMQALTGNTIDSPSLKWEDELEADAQSKSYQITLSWMEGMTGYEYADGVGVLDLSVYAQQKK